MATPEVAGDARLHIGSHCLQTFFADFRKTSGFIDHSSLLSTHAKSASLAGIPASHGLPHLSQSAGFTSLLK